MKKLILLFLILSISIYFVNSETISGSCSIKTSCAVNEVALFSLYEQRDSHVKVDLSGRYKVCCPNNNLTGTTGAQCANPPGKEDSADLLFKAYSNLDSHISSAGSFWQENICLGINSTLSGNVQCTTKSSCGANELGVVSLYQQEDSHVGAVNDYSNKVCCSVTVCPAGFTWDGVKCTPAFFACFLLESKKINPDYLCQSIWTEPMSQSDPYWGDALTPNVQDCFEINNERACCFATSYLGDTYGQYEENNLIKKTIEEIFG